MSVGSNQPGGGRIYSGSTCILPVAVKIDAGVVAPQKKIVYESLNQICGCAADILDAATKVGVSRISKKESRLKCVWFTALFSVLELNQNASVWFIKKLVVHSYLPHLP